MLLVWPDVSRDFEEAWRMAGLVGWWKNGVYGTYAAQWRARHLEMGYGKRLLLPRRTKV